MFKKVSLIIVLILLINTLSAQEKVIPNNPNYQYQSGNDTISQTTPKYIRPAYQPTWSFGGNIGFSFWNNGTDLLIAPKAYYNFSPKFIGGFGLSYNYSDYNGTTTNYTYNSFGGSLLGLYRPIHFLQLSAEFLELYTLRDYNNTSDTYWNSSLYLGISFVTGNFAFGFQYDVIYDVDKSPYSTAWTPVIGFYF